MINKVFCIGLGKTGTFSLNKALNILGIRSTHSKSEISKAIALAKERKTKLLESHSDYQGFTEYPIRIYFKELDRQYPDSKFILTTRDLGPWLRSRKSHIRRNRLDTRYNGNWIIFDKRQLSKLWESWEKEVRAYFLNRTQDLLID